MGTGWSNDERNDSVQSSDTEAQAAKEVEKAKTVEKTTQLKLPYNINAIIRDADTLTDMLSVDKLYNQLHAGVFLNKKRQKYWVDKKSSSNCFMLLASDLSITWGEDKNYWTWSSMKETTSDEFTDVAELLNVCWLEIHGKFHTTKLSPGTLYEVALVIMMKHTSYGLEVPVNLRLTLPDGTKQYRKESLMEKPRGQWINIPVAKFRTSPENIGEIEISMYEYARGEWKSGLVVKGVVIQPKN